MNTPETISFNDARKLVLHSALPPVVKKGRALDATLAAINHLGYVQIDTISVIERAHHHTLWIRNPRYRFDHLDSLMAKRSIFEYWSHAAAYLPMSDYRFCLRKMKEIADGKGHWFQRDPKMMQWVLRRIREEGPLQSRDFASDTQSNRQAWDWKPAKQALEQLFMQGELMTTRRENFQKVYDLTERVLPDHVDTRPPTENEWFTHLIRRSLGANGIANAAEIGYLRKGIKQGLLSTLDHLIESGEVEQVEIKPARGESGLRYFMLPEVRALFDKPLRRKQVRLLSPFDNLLIQRKRIRQLFGFDYQIECYVPEGKRVFGYFCLPILFGSDLVGRIDCKADRPKQTLFVKAVFLEHPIKDMAAFAALFHGALVDFARFNQCHTLAFDRIDHPALKGELAHYPLTFPSPNVA